MGAAERVAPVLIREAPGEGRVEQIADRRDLPRPKVLTTEPSDAHDQTIRPPSAMPRHTPRMTDPSIRRALMEQEERDWKELHGLVDAMPADRVEEPGYFIEGWSAKDLVAHIGSWLAEAGVVL